MLNNPESLTANRNGQITPEQRKAAGIVSSLAIGLVMLSLGAIGGGLFLYGGLTLLNEGDWSGLIMGAFGGVMLSGLGLFALWRLAGAVLTQLDFNEGRIEQAQGEVRWARSRYAADVPGRPRWTSSKVTGLPPGSYQFYYLPRSGRLLSAAALPGLTTGQSLNEVLATVFRVDPESLEMNRHGRMSPRQKTGLWVAAAGTGLFGLAMTALFSMGLWAVMDEGGEGNWIGPGILFLFGLLLAVLMARVVRQLVGDALKGSIKQVKGPLTVSVKSSGKSTSYYYHIARETFTVSPAAYAAVVAGRPYRVYYAPRSRRVLGLETWEKPAVNP
jgi:hypothetical protein